MVAYSTMVLEIPGAALWGCLLFASVIVIILLSVNGAVRMILSSLMQLKPGLRPRKKLVFFISCGILCATTYAIFFFALAVSMKVLDRIVTDWILVLSFIEVCMVAYMFGTGKIKET